MKGFYFLLVTIIFLIMIQIQSGILQNSSTTTTPTTKPATSATSANSANSSKSATSAKSVTSATSASSSITTTHTIKELKGGAPALSGLGSVSVLIFLTNTLIQLLHFS